MRPHDSFTMPPTQSVARVPDVCDLAPSYIRSIAPYQPGKPISELARELNLDPAKIIKLASNENPLGVSPLAMRAIEATLSDLARYPDGNGFELKQALAKRYGVDTSQVVLGNGSNDLLNIAARCFLTPSCEAVYSKHAFAIYQLEIQYTGAKGVEAPARNFGHDVDAMLAAITPRTRMVFIANPNNPTGTLIPAPELHEFLGKVPRNVMVLLDEAYNEYIPQDLKNDSFAWLNEFPNLILTRTFSKAYGLAGLRVGYAFAHPDVADIMNRVRQPFNVNSISLAAAEAGLFDHDFVRKSYELNQTGMVQLTAGLKKLGVAWLPSAGNFLSINVGDGAAVFQRLLQRGVIVRPIGAYAMPEYLRVSIGLESENERFLTALAESLGK